MLAQIEWGKIGQLLWAAPVAGIAVAITFSLVIVGVARAGDARRDGAGGLAAAYSVLTVVATVAFAAVVVFGVWVIIAK